LKTLTADSEALLTRAGVVGTARAEELDLFQFCALATEYRQMRRGAHSASESFPRVDTRGLGGRVKPGHGEKGDQSKRR
jgi:hypothetical protein